MSASEDPSVNAHSHSLINIFIGPFWLGKNAKFSHVDSRDSDQTEQTDLCLCWAHMSESTFPYFATHVLQKYLYLTQTV